MNIFLMAQEHVGIRFLKRLQYVVFQHKFDNLTSKQNNFNPTFWKLKKTLQGLNYEYQSNAKTEKIKWISAMNEVLDAASTTRVDITDNYRKAFRHKVFIGKLVRGKNPRRPEQFTLMRGKKIIKCYYKMFTRKKPPQSIYMDVDDIILLHENNNQTLLDIEIILYP